MQGHDQGFFSRHELPAVSAPVLAPRCGSCKLDKGCKSPKMKPYGQGRLKVLVVGEAPGATEDEQGRPFVGKAGQRLRQSLHRLGVDLDRDCWTSNALACRPKDNEIKDSRSIAWCRPLSRRAIAELRPNVVILLGVVAVKSVIGWLYKEDGGIEQWAGWIVPSQEINAWVCPTWHPSFLLREESPVLDLWFERHLKKAFSLAGAPPWEEVPDYRSQVRVVLDGPVAVNEIRAMAYTGKPLAIDYETNMLKPHPTEGKIVSVAVSNGDTTISTPWFREVQEELKTIWTGGWKKVAANMKFEYLWTREKLGVWPKNVVWDTMLAAHWLDCRRRITSLKFNAFVKLGFGRYNERVEPFLKAESGYEKNKVHQVPLDELLLYGGLDALLEWKVAEKQGAFK